MRTISTQATNALFGSHTVDIRATVYAATLGMITDVPITGGTVTSDASSQVRRTAQIGIGRPDLWPADATGALSPIGSEMSIDYGIVLPGWTEWIPVIRGPVTDVRRVLPSGAGEAITVSIADRSYKVAESRFTAPTQTVSGATTLVEISRLITEVLPAVAVVDETGSTKVTPQIEMQRERWADGIEPLADSIGAEVFADPIGNFVIRPQPDVTDTPVWTIRADHTSILIGEDDEFSRDLTYNRVVASGQRVDGTPPVYAVASDDNPLSPTYINGDFGIKPRFYASPLLTTVAQCQSAADSLLARVIGSHLHISFRTITNPALEAGDVIRLLFDDRDEVHIIDRVDIPLQLGEPQQIKTRSLILPEEAGA